MDLDKPFYTIICQCANYQIPRAEIAQVTPLIVVYLFRGFARFCSTYAPFENRNSTSTLLLLQKIDFAASYIIVLPTIFTVQSNNNMGLSEMRALALRASGSVSLNHDDIGVNGYIKRSPLFLEFAPLKNMVPIPYSAFRWFTTWYA